MKTSELEITIMYVCIACGVGIKIFYLGHGLTLITSVLGNGRVGWVGNGWTPFILIITIKTIVAMPCN